ncbi:GspE/PulE family protein [Roseateles amylovorans]|uniref:ATPase, T2SS/T4P/T4SS family n=1 Tax=Roseateles amylovorans TaxID=2978473 RepID=A0ABY6B7F3_9BURK|nr:ATPase, T2SS/T4P/T4SS family [Roseateles amylovorans]UXH80273.1 ATPase, T2SS/T4P/T4SS family [Roseateles amylovorans]
MSDAVPAESAPSPNRHVSDYAQLPAFDRVISVVADTLVGRDLGKELKVPRAKQNKLMALGLAGQRFMIVSSTDELHSPVWYHLVQGGRQLGLEFAGYVTAEPEIFDLIAYRHENRGASTADREAESEREIEDMVANSSPLEWFRGVIHRCVLAGASDLHLEVRGNMARARVRLDGLMRNLGSFPSRIVMDGVSAAYTVLAEDRSRSEVAFNVGVPQAAMIPVDLSDQRLTLRYQSHPAVGGLDVVMRILRSNSESRTRLLTLDRLGYTDWQTERLQDALSSAWGGIFVAGVTGSGKTTTLNTMMAQLTRQGSRKLITIEDPVEYEMSGVTHLSIQRAADTAVGTNPFHGAMLSFLRMDPDVGLFGEIRDSLSANMAQVAIQTGHKILSTVHATSALGVINRLASPNVGLSREDLCNPEFISALVYQVLVPLNCEHCKVPASQVLTADELQTYAQGFGLDTSRLFCASDHGCQRCRKPGIDYAGSTRNGTMGLKVGAEVIVPDLQMLELLQQRRDLEARRYWRSRLKSPFNDPDMDGKEAWGHVLFDIAQGRVDPFYFERTFGNAAQLAKSLTKD